MPLASGLFDTTASIFAITLTLLPVVALAHRATIVVDSCVRLKPWRPVDRFLGGDEPNLAYRPRGSDLLTALGSLGNDSDEQQKTPTYPRTHDLLTTGDDGLIGVPGLRWGSENAYTEDEDGDPIYNLSIIDMMFDPYLGKNIKPYAEIGFMPRALVHDPEPYSFAFDPAADDNFIWTAWSHRPKDYENWEELLHRWASHAVERYGKDEVNSWYWETWNEPNIPCERDRVSAPMNMLMRFPGIGVGRGRCSSCSTTLPYIRWSCCSSSACRRTRSERDTALGFVSFHAEGEPLLINTTSLEGGSDDGYTQMNM